MAILGVWCSTESFLFLSQAPKASKKKGGKASLGIRAVGKGSKKVDDLDYDNEFGAEFDDFM